MAAEFAAKVAATLAPQATSTLPVSIAPTLTGHGGSDGDGEMKQDELAAETDTVPQHPPGAPQHLSTDDSVKHHPSPVPVPVPSAVVIQPPPPQSMSQQQQRSDDDDDDDASDTQPVSVPVSLSVTPVDTVASPPDSSLPASVPLVVTSSLPASVAVTSSPPVVTSSPPASVAVTSSLVVEMADESLALTTAAAASSLSVSDVVVEPSSTGQLHLYNFTNPVSCYLQLLSR